MVSNTKAAVSERPRTTFIHRKWIACCIWSCGTIGRLTSMCFPFQLNSQGLSNPNSKLPPYLRTHSEGVELRISEKIVDEISTKGKKAFLPLLHNAHSRKHHFEIGMIYKYIFIHWPNHSLYSIDEWSEVSESNTYDIPIRTFIVKYTFVLCISDDADARFLVIALEIAYQFLLWQQ